MTGAELFRLQGEFDITVGAERLFHAISLVADDDDQARRSRLPRGVENMLDHRPPACCVQHLGQVGLHPLALSSGKDDGGGGHGDWWLRGDGMEVSRCLLSDKGTWRRGEYCFRVRSRIPVSTFPLVPLFPCPHAPDRDLNAQSGPASAAYDSSISRSSVVRSDMRRLSASRMASASSRFLDCSSRIFSSTVSWQVRR